MKRKDLAARRQRNRELRQQDAALRCTFCKRPLQQVAVVRFRDGLKFCDDFCLADFEERERLVTR